MSRPIIEMKNIGRSFPSGGEYVSVLRSIDLTIRRGEFVAIMGASGSGKSTLMNIMGCLDKPSEGEYEVSGRSVASLSPDDLAELRREHFGFIFQRYHLLPELTALGNVEIPSIYAGTNKSFRKSNGIAILSRLGMGERLYHRPSQLSGGQQQRVSIARALMNGAEVILADEPTGALDKKSGEEVLKILEELNKEGRTIIIVTHDQAVASRANRVIEISDGEIISDTTKPNNVTIEDRDFDRGVDPSKFAVFGRFQESFHMAVVSMVSHRLRTFLTMLGIIIGIASVVAMVALGAGSTQRVLSEIASLGTNTLEIFPGKDFGDMRSGKVRTLVTADAEVLSKQPYSSGVTPTVSTSTTIRWQAEEASVQVSGVGADYFNVKAVKIDQGRFFDENSVLEMSQEILIDETTKKTLFSDSSESPVGKVVLLGKIPCTIIGVTKKQQGFGPSGNLTVYIPYTTVQIRFLGDTTLRSMIMRVSDDVDTKLAEQAVTKVLTARHGVKDFFIFNTDDIRQTITSTTQTMTLLIAAIAVISLVVGGIGVMNIMLVSVSERVKEIGVRMAVGARRSDILQQFLTEAVIVCLVGGVIGILTAFGIGFSFQMVGSHYTFVYSATTICLAFACSSLIGIVFGWLPAHGASKLDPVEALSRD